MIVSFCSGATLRQLSSIEFNRFVDIERKINVRDLYKASLRDNAFFVSVNMNRYNEAKHVDLLVVVFKMLKRSQLEEIFPPNQHFVFELLKALDLLKSRDRNNKLVITLEKSVVVSLLPQVSPTLKLKADAIYIMFDDLETLRLIIAENIY